MFLCINSFNYVDNKAEGILFLEVLRLRRKVIAFPHLHLPQLPRRLSEMSADQLFLKCSVPDK